ncbi:hypothetical protein IWX90DRAFT_417514 [Phyllosticta citrichinensis]|uniref:Uncharacterized protein n=1 Tax=Phyllosticta citrichinensis TaxID=1130410 RepID=A0ABR1XL67_9PEZI
MASNLPRDSRLAIWLSACQNRPSFDLSATPTPYSAASFSKSSDFLPPFLGLLQCRHDIDGAIAQLERAKRVVDVKAQLANMRTRFQRLVQNTSADFWKNAARMGIAAMPFEEIQFSQEGKSHQFPDVEVLTEESSEEDEGEADEDDDEPSESEEEDPKEAWTRFQRTRRMHILHYVVSRHRVGRLIANVKGSGSMILRQQVQAGAAPPALRGQVIAELEVIATMAKTELAREMQGESGATEAYRVAMIAVLQAELRT